MEAVERLRGSRSVAQRWRQRREQRQAQEKESDAVNGRNTKGHAVKRLKSPGSMVLRIYSSW